MKNPRRLSRRRLLLASGACATVAALGRVAAADKLRLTPAQVLGPFYPLEKPLDDDADLTMVRGHQARAEGQVVHVMGRVVNAEGEPVQRAQIEIWQANAHGRYTHPGDDNPAPLDPNFEGYAKLLADADGRYRFKTIKPAGYPAGYTMRPPHIHFDVAGKHDRLITQMYFPGDPENENDPVMARVTKNRQLLVAEILAPTPDLEPDSLLARWDIVLENG
jgi:protocatechuate 3,4-dioxygenase beta subunit